MRQVLLCALLLLATDVTAAASSAAAAPFRVINVEVRDAIGPATREHIVAAIGHAEASGAGLVLLTLDTPGGLDASMRDIVQAILNARVPIVTFVAPRGARAASAGTFIVYASHVAAMAPGTALGAATPVPVGGSAPASGREKDQPTLSASERKSINDAIAYIRSLAELRGRNVQFAEAAVASAASLPAHEALAQGVVDLVAGDVPGLLAALDGREVRLPGGVVRLTTAGATVERFEAGWRIQLLSVITNPLVAYGLLLIGIYGLLFEGYNPGVMFPGVIGAICLLLGLYALQVLSVNNAGLGLLLLGLVMMIAEVFVPSFGALGMGGLAAFILGSVILMDTGVPGFEVSRGLVGGVAATAGLAMFGTVWLANRARRRPVATGVEQLVGSEAAAIESFSGAGTVRVQGEIWNAVSEGPVAAGQRVRIARVDGLTLYVTPLD